MKRTILIALLFCLALPLMAADDVGKMIRANTESFDSAMRASNVDGFMAFYATDAVLMPPNAPAFNGVENVRKFWGGLLSMGKTDVDLVTDDVITSGDLAVERGHFELTLPFKDSGSTSSSGASATASGRSSTTFSIRVCSRLRPRRSNAAAGRRRASRRGRRRSKACARVPPVRNAGVPAGWTGAVSAPCPCPRPLPRPGRAASEATAR